MNVEVAHVAHVEIDRARSSLLSHAFAGDGASDHIAWGKLEQRMVALHEALTAIVNEVGAFAAESFREQEARSARQRKGRGVELVELHVSQFGAGLCGECDAVSGGHRGVGGIGIDLARSSSCDEHGVRGYADVSFL